MRRWWPALRRWIAQALGRQDPQPAAGTAAGRQATGALLVLACSGLLGCGGLIHFDKALEWHTHACPCGCVQPCPVPP